MLVLNTKRHPLTPSDCERLRTGCVLGTPDLLYPSTYLGLPMKSRKRLRSGVVIECHNPAIGAVTTSRSRATKGRAVVVIGSSGPLGSRPATASGRPGTECRRGARGPRRTRG